MRIMPAARLPEYWNTAAPPGIPLALERRHAAKAPTS
jgi:hypothetical protein